MSVNEVELLEVVTAASSDHVEDAGQRGVGMSMDSGSRQELAALRQRIDETDRHLAEVLRERGRLAAHAARLKVLAGVPASARRDWAREHEIVERAVALVCAEAGDELVRGGYDEATLRAFYDVLFEASTRFVQNELRYPLIGPALLS